MNDDVRSAHEQNRRSWNAATAAHQSHKPNQVTFFRKGGSTLFDEELQLLGRDVAQLSVAHLQCGCGEDSLSLARLGAHVVGVDISDAAIEEARRLSAATGVAASFDREDVLVWLNRKAGEAARFDVVMATYGCLTWIGDLQHWARGVASILKLEGRLVLVDFHPLVRSFDERGTLAVGDPYFGARGRCDNPAGVGDYVAQSGHGLIPEGMGPGDGEQGTAESAFANPEPTVEFAYTSGALVSALAGAGLHVEAMREYPFINGRQLFAGMQPLPGRRYGMPAGLPQLPLMLSIVAVHRRAPAAPPTAAKTSEGWQMPQPSRAARLARMRATGFDSSRTFDDGEGY